MAEYWTFPPLSAFEPAPADGFLFVADVEGSTRRVTGTGEYKDITFVATAALVAVENTVGPIPGVFTGDGALVFADPAREAEVGRALAAVAGWARTNMDMGVRVARIPTSALMAPLLVAQQPMPQAVQWHFLGGGATEADMLSKHADEFRLAPDPEGSPNLTGLSCRWDPVRNGRGALVSILVQSHELDAETSYTTLAQLYREIASAAAPDERLWPVREDNLRFSWPPPGLDLEAAAMVPRPGPRRALVKARLLAETGLAAVFLKARAKPAMDYAVSVGRNAVAAQVIDGLAMIIDCTEAQHQAIRTLLERRHAERRVIFGTYASEQAYMTCVVRSLEEHRHFIDATVGGYWHAAKELKRQAGRH